MKGKDILRWLGTGANIMVFLAAIVDGVLFGFWFYILWMPISIEGFRRLLLEISISIWSLSFIYLFSRYVIFKKTNTKLLFFCMILLKLILVFLSIFLICGLYAQLKEWSFF